MYLLTLQLTLSVGRQLTLETFLFFFIFEYIELSQYTEANNVKEQN